MVKRTQRKYLLQAVKKTGVSFFAVALIAATSVAIYLGIRSGAVAILQCADDYFRENKLATAEITCANGITQEDVDVLSGQSGADTVEGAYKTMVLMESEREKIIVQVRSLLEEMNQAVVLKGELPIAEDEVAIEQKFATEQGISLGDEIHISHDGELLHDIFRVTAIINEPSFSCADINDARGKDEIGIGSASYYMEVSKAAFDASYYDDCYPIVYVENTAVNDIYFYAEEYAQKEEELLGSLEAFGEERAKLRYDSLVQEADEKISDAEKKLSDAESELADKETELSDAKEEYQTKEAELSDAKEELAKGKKELEDTLQVIDTALKELGLSEDLSTAKTQLSAFGAAGMSLSSAITEYQEGIDKIAEAEAELSEKNDELLEAAAEIEDAEQKIEEAKPELLDARSELEDAKKEIEDLEQKEWIISGRNSMGDVHGIKIIVEGLFTLSYSFALIFLLVAIVVCYASVVKMINDQRMLIGAQKALGFTTKEIFLHYLSYNILCAILGIILGCVAGVVIVENLVLYVFKSEFLYEKIPLAFVWKEAGIVAVLCLIIFIAATYAGCIKVITQPAVSLLRGELPVQQKAYFFESWKIYKKLNLYSRTMIKNVLSDKGRILTTIMGVVGCISLLIITFTLKFSISNAMDMQFKYYYFYENRLVVDSNACDIADYEKILDEEGISYRRIQDKLKNFRTKGEDWETIHIVAIEDEKELEGFIYLEDIKTKEQISLPKDGVLISRKCAENFDLDKGSVIEIMDQEGNAKECRVAGVIEHYLPYHQIVTSVEYYEEISGETSDLCVFLLKGDINGLYEKVREKDGFMSLKDNSEYQNEFSSINLVIGICLAFSAILAVLVLLNQINMYINKKAKELAVMRINGYTLKETKAFVSRDNIVLIGLGLILGSMVGTPLAQLEVYVMETGSSHYITTPSLPACLLSVIVCIIFAFIINKIAVRRIDHLSLTNVSGN